jgi:hypothetical protein
MQTRWRIAALIWAKRSGASPKNGTGETGRADSMRRQTMTETEVISIDRHGQRKEYPSIKSAAEDVGVRPCRISTACVTAHRCAGRYWIKKEDMDGS